MFLYDATILSTVQSDPQSVADVLQILQTIDGIVPREDGLKWFNWLYLQVTIAVRERIAAGGFSDPSWLEKLDVQFACLYFSALRRRLSGQSAPDCWQVVLVRRADTKLARVQFALAGINAHINHDLPAAIVKTCEISGSTPQHDSPQYTGYMALNSTLDSLVESAKQELHVRLLGDPLPPIAHLEDAIAAWNIAAARQAAWTNAEMLWAVRNIPPLTARFMDMLDGITALAGKALLVDLPAAVAGAAEA
jgi:hypothetical protein